MVELIYILLAQFDGQALNSVTSRLAWLILKRCWAGSWKAQSHLSPTSLDNGTKIQLDEGLVLTFYSMLESLQSTTINFEIVKGEELEDRTQKQ
jgi:hypothetical protein